VNRFLRHLPNTLTLLRLLSAPAMAFLILHDVGKLALGLFAFAGVSDALDGYLAKRLQWSSSFGAWLDPAADKLLMVACFVTLSLTRPDMTPVWLTVLVIGRDVAIIAGITLLRFLSIPVEIAPSTIGKASTGFQVVYVGLMLVMLAFGFAAPRMVLAMQYAVALFTAASWIGYGQVLVRALSLGRGTA
jgi:cardiolipin synthase